MFLRSKNNGSRCRVRRHCRSLRNEPSTRAVYTNYTYDYVFHVEHQQATVILALGCATAGGLIDRQRLLKFAERTSMCARARSNSLTRSNPPRWIMIRKLRPGFFSFFLSFPLTIIADDRPRHSGPCTCVYEGHGRGIDNRANMLDSINLFACRSHARMLGETENPQVIERLRSCEAIPVRGPGEQF